MLSQKKPNTSENTSLKGYLLAGIIVLIWTGFILVSRVGGISQLTSWDLIAVRYATAAALLLPIWWFKRRRPLFTQKLMLLAMLGGLIYAVLAFAAFKITSAAHAAILLPGLQPFTVTVIAWLLLNETPNANRVTGLFIVGLGVACLVMDAIQTSVAVFYGDLLMLAASICWSCYSVLLRRWSVTPWDATIAVTLLTALVYLPVYLLALPKHVMAASWSDIVIQAIYQGIVATIIQMVLYVRTIELIGPTRLGLLMALIPGLAGLAAVPLLHEPLSLWTFTGLILVGLGAWIGNRFFITKSKEKSCLM